MRFQQYLWYTLIFVWISIACSFVYKKNNQPIASVDLKKIAPEALFMVHKHASSHLHYDLRLSINGVLKSWAIPKGPSVKYGQKRLAILTNDHDLNYAYFEGTLPSGSRGAGPVMIWDIGSFENKTERGNRVLSLTKALKNGHLKIFLHGQRLQGLYLLERIKRSTDQWLLMKLDDEYADNAIDIVNRYTRSVVSNNTMAQISDIHKKMKTQHG